MQCPRCESSVLEERDREGVVIDVCKTCRGLWLDRGELEKLIARTTADIDDHDRRRGAAYPEPARQPPREYPREPSRDYDRDRDRDYDDYRRKYPRKKSLFESLGDIFD